MLAMDIFSQVSLLLVVATGCSFLVQRLRWPIVVGHLVAGIFVGPAFLNLIQSREVVEVFSQFGIVALLFVVGLGLAPQVMREVGKAAVIVGAGQMLLSAILGFLLSLAAGFSIVVSLYVAVALALSSTIIVSKFLADRHEIGLLHGKLAIGVLLIQDVVATVLLVILSATREGFILSDLLGLVFRGIFLMALLYPVCVYVLPRLGTWYAHSQEFLFLFSLGWGLGLALVFRAFGFSLEIGALVAGVTLAGSPYHYEIAAKIKLLRDFFLVPFFVLLGATLLPGTLWSQWPMILFLSAFVLTMKPLLTSLLLLALGYHRKTAILAGLPLGQVSEFSFLLVILGMRAGHLSNEIVTLVTAVGLVSMVGSVFFLEHGSQIERAVAPLLHRFAHHKVRVSHRRGQDRFEAILFGCHRVGEDFLRLLREKKSTFLVVDYDPGTIERLASIGVPCRYGDAANNDFLDEIGLRHVKLVISTLPDFETNAFLLAKMRHVNRRAMVLMVAQGAEEALLLYRQGADYVILPHFLGGNYASLLLEKHGADPLHFAREKRNHVRHLTRRAFPLAGQPARGVH